MIFWETREGQIFIVFVTKFRKDEWSKNLEMLCYDFLACHYEQHILKENDNLHLDIGVVGHYNHCWRSQKLTNTKTLH